MSFLRLSENISFELVIPDTVPDLQVDISIAQQEAKENHPEILRLENELLLAQSEVRKKKADKGVNADLELALGYSRVDNEFPEIVTGSDNTSKYQNFRVGVNIPIIDWGIQRGYYEIALLNEEIVRLQVEQDIIDFEQRIMLQVMHFNQQMTQFEIVKKSDIVAERRYEVSKHRFLVGKIDVLDLNVSQKERDEERRNYINSLREYWNAYYSIRKSTLYDFIYNSKIK